MAALLLAPLGMLYGASVAWKARHTLSAQIAARVICIGNLTAGGSGKTPVALAIGARVQAKGKRIFFLTRGYGGSEAGPLRVTAQNTVQQVGDEALLLAAVAPTIVARDRAAGAALAVAEGAEVIVMDDGHQNFGLTKDLSLVVVDGEAGFGNGLMIPAGPLREPVAQGLSRADAVIVMNGRVPDLAAYRGPVLQARLAVSGDMFARQRVFAFAGIGRPEKFVTSLKEAGAVVTGSRFFPDHHPFQPGEIDALKASAAGVQLVTTQKDFVRLTAQDRKDVAVLPVEAHFADTVALDALLARLA
ncbi:MAG TPA: tetraacyldisaccharide 4'-kinase [Rhizomicrobium sp.]